MRSILTAITFAVLAVPAGAADLGFPYKAPPGAAPPWFVYMGLETGGAVTQHSFDFLGTGTGTVQIGGALAGALVGLEYKSPFFMGRIEVDGDYDFGRGGAMCMGGTIACHINRGGIVTERVDIGLPQGWLGGATPYVSAGAQQAQVFAAVDGVGTASQWTNAFLAGAGIDLPAGQLFSMGFRWDHVWTAQAITLVAPAAVPVVANNAASDIFKVNLKWRLN